MTYLPSLIQKIDNFYSLAESLTRLKRMAATPTTFSMPDDPEEEDEALPGDEFSGLYSKAMETIKEIANTDMYDEVVSELFMIVELYKKALEINGGFQELQKRIGRTGASVDALIDESDGDSGEDVRELAYEVLEDLSSDLRKRAKSTVAPQADDATAAKAFKEVRDRVNSAQAQHEMLSQRQEFEKGPKGQEGGHNINIRHAETPEKYAKEIARLKATLETERDPNNINNIQYLIGTLESLLKAMKDVKQLESDVKVSPDDPPTVKAFEEATKNLSALRKQRLLYRRKLNNAILKDEQTQLRRKMYETRNPKEKDWLDQQVALLDLRMDDKLLRKRDMIRAIRAKINSTGTLDEEGDFQSLTMPEATRQALDAALKAGRKKTITKSDYDRELTEQRVTEQGRKPEDVARLPGHRGGYRPVVQKDFNKFTFPGLIKELRDKKNTAIDSARRYITSAKERGRIELKDDVKAVSDAIKKNDNVARTKAINSLRVKIYENFQKQGFAFQSYRRSLKLLAIINKFEKLFEQMVRYQDEQGIWQIQNTEFLEKLIADITKLAEQYPTYYQDQSTFSSLIRPRFESVIRFLNVEIKNYIKENILKIEDVAEKTASQTRMRILSHLRDGRDISTSNNRMSILTRIVEEVDIIKIAQEVLPKPTEVDTTTADQLAEQIFDKLFDTELSTLIAQS